MGCLGFPVLFPAVLWFGLMLVCPESTLGQAVESEFIRTVGHSVINPDGQNSAVQLSHEAAEEAPSVWVPSLSSNHVSITPYGSLWGNLYFASSRTNPGSFTLWVFSEEDQGEPAFDLDARRSRVGIEVAGPRTGLGGYETGGRVEVDFFGQFLTENRAGARLRHAYFEAKHGDWRFLLGQTWDVVSPLRPGMLNFTGTWGAGNIGFRRAQFRVERTIEWENEAEWLFEGSLNQDIVDDFPIDPGVRRESSTYPVVEGRAAIRVSSFFESERDLTLGLSGHYGETGFDFIQPGPPPLNLPPADDTRFKTWSINFDAEVPLAENLIVRGEVFRGANLSPFLGGIGQGVCPCLRKSIHSTGGWLELVRDWSPAWESHFGAGIDDPADEDALFGRVQNQVVFGNLIWQITNELSTGWEVAYWRTLYQERRAGQIAPALLTPSTPGEAVTLEWMLRYEF